MDNETKELRRRIFKAYNEQHPTWGSLHIVLEDENEDVENFYWCKQYAEDNNDLVGAFLCDLLIEADSIDDIFNFDKENQNENNN